VPCVPVLRAARAGGFAGPVVLEHEARWHPEAAPIDAAIDGAQALVAAARDTAGPPTESPWAAAGRC
jgi:hypothetical protein